MVAVLLTELERAIIDNIRTKFVMLECVVCNTAELPYTAEGMDYMRGCMKNSGKEAMMQLEKQQEQRLKNFRTSGYGEVVEVGKEKTKVHLKRI